MMAKMFYTLDETKAALGRDDDAIKRLTGEGRLREFRDGPRLMYKADQVETLKTELETGGDEITLGPSDTGAPIGLVDSRSGSSPVISLSDSNTGSGNAMKEDTALAADLGLSNSIGLSQSIGLASSTPGTPSPGGSIGGASPAGGSMAGGSLAGSMGGIPSPARPAQNAGSGLSGLSGSGSRGGINILEDEDNADPRAQTVTNDLGAEAMGSGSGLLDLTRESDNTSLGAVLDEIPGGSMAGGSLAGNSLAGSLAGGSLAGSFAGGTLSGGSLVGTRGAETMGATVSSSGPGMPTIGSGRVITPPTYVEARDALAPAFGGAALLAAIFGLFALYVLAGGVLNTRSGLLTTLAERNLTGLPVIAGIGAGLALIGFIVGLIIGRVRA